MDYEAVLLTKEKGVGILTLNRPQVLNALSQTMTREIRQAALEVKQDKDIRVLIVTGAGDKAFCAGRDLKEYDGYELNAIEDWERRAQPGGAFFDLVEMPKPVIAAVNGYALAGGMELALACDIRYASERATFGLFEIRRGIYPGAGATWRLTPLVGKGWATQLVLSGEAIDAREAERIGLVNRTVPHDQLMPTVMELAAKIANLSPVALMLAKAAITQAWEPYERTGYNLCNALRALVEVSEDRKEGVRAFVEKRPPVFKGR